MITAAQNAASIHNGENTHHQDQVMTLHHFRMANTAQSNAGHIILKRTLFLIVGSVVLVDRGGLEPPFNPDPHQAVAILPLN